MKSAPRSIYLIATIVALGGLLMGFDASVISGVGKFIEAEFELGKLELGWAVASLTLSATLAMMMAGPISDQIGRKKSLQIAAALYTLSAIGSAFAPTYFWLVAARMLGGLGVGASLILAPMYIAEIAPAEKRGQLVSVNQLNIVLGISLAFFSNYIILRWSQSGGELANSLQLDANNWRWMLGVEAIPALMYLIGLVYVPRSPRWLIVKGHIEEARQVLSRISNPASANAEIQLIKASLNEAPEKGSLPFKLLFSPAMRNVLLIGVVVSILQQATGINAIFFYAPMIFEQSGIGTDASFMQAVLVGLVNLVFTIASMFIIDRFGRRPLLLVGVFGITISMLFLSYQFNQATYTIDGSQLEFLSESSQLRLDEKLSTQVFATKQSFIEVIDPILASNGETDQLNAVVDASIDLNPMMILLGILAFVASFAISLGPVMWVLFSELFPNAVRGLAISFVGLINSIVSFVVQWVFPWELDALGSSATFMIFGLIAMIGLFFIAWKVPETKGKSLEELSKQLVQS